MVHIEKTRARRVKRPNSAANRSFSSSKNASRRESLRSSSKSIHVTKQHSETMPAKAPEGDSFAHSEHAATERKENKQDVIELEETRSANNLSCML